MSKHKFKVGETVKIIFHQGFHLSSRGIKIGDTVVIENLCDASYRDDIPSYHIRYGTSLCVAEEHELGPLDDKKPTMKIDYLSVTREVVGG